MFRSLAVAGCALMLLAVRPHGASADGKLGIYEGAGCDGARRIGRFTHWLGRSPAWVIDFLAYDSWRSMRHSAEWILRCWRGAPYHLSLAVPLLPQDETATLADGARGAYDSDFRELAELLVRDGRADAVIRLGWEFNGAWMPWNAAKDPAAFVTYWRRVVAVMRAVRGAAFRFDWAPSLGRNAIAPDLVYPGDDVVDVIGLSVYNQSWSKPRRDSAARWQELLSRPFGLDWQRQFAQAHRKLRSFPEWGTGRRPDGAGGGDDPGFITRMAALIRAPDVLYDGYWDYPAPDYFALISTGEFPRAAAAFRRAFGRPRD